MGEESGSRFAFGRKSFLLWVVLFSASVFFLIDEGDEVSLAAWVLLVAAICLPSLLYQDVKLRRRTVDLLTKGVSLESYSYKRQTRVVRAIAFLGVAGLLGPLILLGVIPSDVWFGSLVGILDGWLLYLILLNTGIWLWERRHLGILYRFELWNGAGVTQVGLRFRKHGGA